MAIRIEYDRDKDIANRRKHGLSLELGALVIMAASQIVLDDESDEERWQAFGWVNGRFLTCIYALRPDETHRIISVRKATKAELKRQAARSE